MMGKIATAALDAGGKVHGIIPSAVRCAGSLSQSKTAQVALTVDSSLQFLSAEAPDRGANSREHETETVVGSMHERKKLSEAGPRRNSSLGGFWLQSETRQLMFGVFGRTRSGGFERRVHRFARRIRHPRGSSWSMALAAVSCILNRCDVPPSSAGSRRNDDLVPDRRPPEASHPPQRQQFLLVPARLYSKVSRDDRSPLVPPVACPQRIVRQSLSAAWPNFGFLPHLPLSAVPSRPDSSAQNSPTSSSLSTGRPRARARAAVTRHRSIGDSRRWPRFAIGTPRAPEGPNRTALNGAMIARRPKECCERRLQDGIVAG